ncbi:hypothetical protein BZG79_14270 [Salinivibrio sp. MA427]|uniref:outer membrane beta-barrel protein n=1 Tax=unclassified Salinivibrio TaxID=2636825 RepID=UPI000988AE80|nr:MULTISPECIES: outer membrane beta-barrel protein [unclassified Salinivibrio]OOF02319.1 hypothetical protein BZG80_12850 [Salinivibrio sp. MA440]OOF03703.1 hypothetical protein BZG79_14270 [Salinivibrio sp. MA427]
MKKVVTGLGLLLAVAPAAYAQQDSGLYMGGRIGPSFLEDSCVSDTDCGDQELGAGIITGYDFNDWFALEGTYDYLGRFDTEFDTFGKASGDLTALTLAPKLSYHVKPDTALYGKVGGAMWNFNSNAGDRDDVSLMGAIGVDHQATDKLNLRLEYQHINDMDDGYFSSVDNNLVTVGMTYHFGRTASEPMTEAMVEEPVMAEPEPVQEPEPVAEPQSIVLSEAGETEMFGFDKATLSEQAVASLQPLVDRLLKHEEATATIVGHTDSQGPAAYNQTLSEERAQVVADVFLDAGIAAERLTVMGKGESAPTASNETADGRAKNRRVEVTSPEFVYVDVN